MEPRSTAVSSVQHQDPKRWTTAMVDLTRNSDASFWTRIQEANSDLSGLGNVKSGVNATAASSSLAASRRLEPIFARPLYLLLIGNAFAYAKTNITIRQNLVKLLSRCPGASGFLGAA